MTFLDCEIFQDKVSTSGLETSYVSICFHGFLMPHKYFFCWIYKHSCRYPIINPFRGIIVNFAAMINIFLKRKISHRILNGHPWIFANEVEKVDGESIGGEVAEIFTHDKKFVGRGYINPKSQILVRLLTRNRAEEINEKFFISRLVAKNNLLSKGFLRGRGNFSFLFLRKRRVV